MARTAGTETYEPQIAVQEGLRRPVPEYRPSTIGTALGQFADTAQQAYQNVQQKDAHAHLITAVPQALVQSTKIMLDAKEQPRDVIDAAGGFTPYIMRQFNAYAQDAVKTAAGVNRVAEGAMQSHLQAMGAKLQADALESDASWRIQSRVDAAEQGIQAAAAAVRLNPGLLDSVGRQQIQSQAGLGIDEKSRENLGQKAFDQLHVAAANGIAEQNPADALNRLRDPNDALFTHLSLQQRELTEGFAKSKMAGQISDALVANYRSNGAAEGAKGLRALASNPNVPDDIKDKIYGQVQTGVGLWRDEQRQVHADAIIGLNDRIGSGKTTLADRGLVLGLYKQGVYGAEETGNKLGDIDRQQLKRAEDTVDVTNAINAYRNSTAMDPEDQGVKSGTNQMFNQMTMSVPTGSQEWTNAAADISRKTGVTPGYAVDWARTQLVSADNDKAAAAADAIKRLQDANPRGIAFALDDKTKAMASNINKFIAGGADVAAAVSRARQMDQIPEAERKKLQDIYDAKKEKSIANLAEPTLHRLVSEDERYQAHGTGWFGTDFRKDPPPPAPVAMQAEFESNRADYFKMTGGDIDQANQLAYQDLKHVWGVSDVNGQRQLMKYAPESMNPGLTTAYLREDMIKSAEKLIADTQPNAEYIKKFAPELAGHYFTPEGQDAKPWEKARLVPDPEATEHSQGQRWQLHVPNANGFYTPLVNPKTGSPWLYQLPSAASSDQAARAAALDKARQDIAREHESQKDLIEAQTTAAEQGGGF